MARTALDRAEGLFATGRYAELVSLFEPQVPVYQGVPALLLPSRLLLPPLRRSRAGRSPT